MRKLFIFTAVIVALLYAQSAFGQRNPEKSSKEGTATVQTSVVSEPTAQVIYKTPRKVSPMITKVRSLCDGDDVLTEMVCAEIYKTKDIKIKDIIDDEDYQKMTLDEQALCVCEGEVIEIINRLMN